MADKKAKAQRVKLRMVGNPVKWDAVVVAMAPTSTTEPSWVDVEFDGPLPNMRLYAGMGNRRGMLCSWQTVDECVNPPADGLMFEVI